MSVIFASLSLSLSLFFLVQFLRRGPHLLPTKAFYPGAPNDGFLLQTLKTLLRLSRVLLAIQKCGLWGPLKFVPVLSSQANFSEPFQKLQRLQYYFPEYFRCNLTYYENEGFSDSSVHYIFESENFRFPFFYENSLTWE